MGIDPMDPQLTGSRAEHSRCHPRAVPSACPSRGGFIPGHWASLPAWLVMPPGAWSCVLRAVGEGTGDGQASGSPAG